MNLHRRALKFAAPWFLRLHGVKVGRGPTFVGGFPLIDSGSHIVMGDDVKIRSHQFPAHLGTASTGTLTIEDHVFINQGTAIYACSRIRIGAGTMIADLVAIFDTDFHQVEQDAETRVAPIDIGRNVWLGRGVTVLPGVTIGDHAVIAAGAVVSHDVPRGVLAGGVPAKKLRELRVSPSFVRK